MAHGTNIAVNSGRTWPRLSMEYVIATAPAVIIDGQMGDDPVAWQLLAAIYDHSGGAQSPLSGTRRTRY